MSTTVLHVFPESVLEPGQEHLGSTKDIRGRTQYFRDRDVEVTELAHHRSATGLLQAVRSQRPERYDAVVVEFPLSARATSELRRWSPRPLLLTRSANAELLHRTDWMRAHGLSVAAAKLAVRTAQTGTAELWAGWRSDHVLSISRWETEHYWPRLGAGHRVSWLPYYVPDDYLDELVPLPEPRELTCVCLTSTKHNPVIEDSVRGFERAVASLGNRSREWSFVVTGDAAPSEDPRIRSTGMLASPGDVLRGSKAVALLSDLGYGFKTKLLDAAMAGNWILVTPGLRRRVPPELDPWTLTVDPRRPDSFAAALDQARKPVPPGRPNDDLRERHHAVLDRLLGLAAGPAR